MTPLICGTKLHIDNVPRYAKEMRTMRFYRSSEVLNAHADCNGYRADQNRLLDYTSSAYRRMINCNSEKKEGAFIQENA